MKTLVRQALSATLTYPPTISLEEEVVAVVDAEDARLQAVQELEEAERALDVTDALEDLAFVADSIKVATPREAALIQIVADTAVAGTGVDGSAVAPSMEDEGDANKGGRVRQVIAKIVETIKAVLKAIWESIQAFFSNLFKTIGNVKGRIEALHERVKEAKDGDKLEEIRARGFALDGKVITGANDIMRGLKSYDTELSNFVADHGQYAYGMGSTLVKFYGAAAVESTQPDALKALLKPLLKQGSNGSVTELMGGISISFNPSSVETPADDATPAQVLGAVINSHPQYVVASTGATGSSEAQPKFKAFTVAQVEATLKELDALVLHLNEKADKNFLGAAAKGRADFGNAVGTQITKSVAAFKMEGDMTAEPYVARMGCETIAPRAVSFFTKMSTQPYTALLSNTLRVVNQTISILTQSLDAGKTVQP